MALLRDVDVEAPDGDGAPDVGHGLVRGQPHEVPAVAGVDGPYLAGHDVDHLEQELRVHHVDAVGRAVEREPALRGGLAEDEGLGMLGDVGGRERAYPLDGLVMDVRGQGGPLRAHDGPQEHVRDQGADIVPQAVEHLRLLVVLVVVRRHDACPDGALDDERLRVQLAVRPLEQVLVDACERVVVVRDGCGPVRPVDVIAEPVRDGLHADRDAVRVEHRGDGLRDVVLACGHDLDVVDRVRVVHAVGLAVDGGRHGEPRHERVELCHGPGRLPQDAAVAAVVREDAERLACRHARPRAVDAAAAVDGARHRDGLLLVSHDVSYFF